MYEQINGHYLGIRLLAKPVPRSNPEIPETYPDDRLKNKLVI